MMDTHSQKPKNELSHALPNTKSSSHPSLVMNEHQTGEYDGKVKITISSERFSQLKKMVEEAIRDHKVFTIKGGWQILRRSLLSRHWVEKFESKPQKPPASNPSSAATGNILPLPVSVVSDAPATLEDVCKNLPAKQEWETPAAHKEKCEKTVMSRLLNMYDADFYWNLKKDSADWSHRCNPLQIMNRFCRSLFTSKEGLCLLLQQMYWFNEPEVANVNFPRCYVLGFPDHYNNFIDDFRITACMCLLKWFVDKVESGDQFAVISPEGTVPATDLNFAMFRCNDYVATQRHFDIDAELMKVTDSEWDNFLSHYYCVMHKKGKFIFTKEVNLQLLLASSKAALRNISKYWPQYHLDGMRNIWILKPGNKCRGRGIQLMRTAEDVTKIMNMKLKYVVQKYIERPLIIYKTKFDIRQWFLVTCVQPLTIWMYKESYLRFSSQIFSLENFHESLHLTNHAVQCKYTNGNLRDKALPEDNMWDCHTFKSYLKQLGQDHKWDEVVYPGMRECIVGSMLASQETMDRRPNTFELYGADFILAEDLKPWLLEINSCPDLSHSTTVTARMCPQCLQDLIKVVIDKRNDPKADTGQFELVYKQNMPRAPAYLGMSLCVRGKKVFKSKKTKVKREDSQRKIKNTPYHKPEDGNSTYVSAIPTIYNGPVIHDLIDEINSYYDSNENGVDFVSASQAALTKKKPNKNDRVSKSHSHSHIVTNHKSFPNRKPRESENCENGCEPLQNLNRSIGVSKKIISERVAVSKADEDSQIKNCKTHWENETSSILEGTNILTKLNINQNSSNKSISNEVLCFGHGSKI